MAASVAAGRAGEMAMKAAGIRTTDDAAMRWADAAVGCAAFVLLGGRFPRVLMSDVRFVGANATRSIPAAGSQYANASQKARLQAIFDRHGCHTCGTRRRNVGVVADHQPPTKLNYGTGGANASAELTRRRGWLAPLLPPPPKQRYFPQCATCSNRQSSAVANNRQVLVYNGALALALPTLLGGAAVATSRLAAPDTHERLGVWLQGTAAPVLARAALNGADAVRGWIADAHRSLRRP